MMVRFQTGFAAQYRARRGSTLMTCRVYPPARASAAFSRPCLAATSLCTCSAARAGSQEDVNEELYAVAHLVYEHVHPLHPCRGKGRLRDDGCPDAGSETESISGEGVVARRLLETRSVRQSCNFESWITCNEVRA